MKTWKATNSKKALKLIKKAKQGDILILDERTNKALVKAGEKK